MIHRYKNLSKQKKRKLYQCITNQIILYIECNISILNFSFPIKQFRSSRKKQMQIYRKTKRTSTERQTGTEQKNTCEFRFLSLKTQWVFCPDGAAAPSLCVVLFKNRVAILQMKLWRQMKFTLNELQIHSPQILIVGSESMIYGPYCLSRWWQKTAGSLSVVQTAWT